MSGVLNPPPDPSSVDLPPDADGAGRALGVIVPVADRQVGTGPGLRQLSAKLFTTVWAPLMFTWRATGPGDPAPSFDDARPPAAAVPLETATSLATAPRHVDGAAPSRQPQPVLHGVLAGLPRQLGRFTVIGLLCTLTYVVLYLLWRGPMGDQLANATAMLVTAIANTAGNRRFTFSRRGPDGILRQHAYGLIIFAVGLAVSSGALAIVHAITPHADATLEVLALMTANLIATALRFVLLRSWVFSPDRA
jgi:putative flippase GtrA